MSENTADHDLLLRLDTKFDMLTEEVRRAASGPGYPRCAERLAHLEAVEEDVQTLHKRIDSSNSRFWWLITFIVGQAVAFVLAVLKGGKT